jgi:molybdopterin converting factor small subunit
MVKNFMEVYYFNMEVKIFASYREKSGVESIQIENNIDIKKLISILLKDYNLSDKNSSNEEEFYENSIILINGNNCKTMKGINTVIPLESVVSIFPVICGG